MPKKRKAIPARKKALLQKEIDSICPVCENEDVEHFQIHHIDENSENDDFENLLMLCPICHSKITKGDIHRSEVILLKKDLKQKVWENKPAMGKVISFYSKVGNAVVGDNNNVTINQRKSVVNKYPQGCIGADVIKANYIGYLISRYQEYKQHEIGKDKMVYAIFHSNLKKKFKIGKTRTVYHVPINRFEEMAEYIQSRIENTRLAKINRSKQQYKNFQTFQEYITSQSSK